jgi:hypothetical protein
LKIDIALAVFTNPGSTHFGVDPGAKCGTLPPGENIFEHAHEGAITEGGGAAQPPLDDLITLTGLFARAPFG